jgi:hypothetical protein
MIRVSPLKQGGMRGGGQCHNSVKAGIFKNSVRSLSAVTRAY